MRHELFEEMAREKEFSFQVARSHVSHITRRNAEGLLACRVSSTEAEEEVLKVWPQIERFVKEYTLFQSSGQEFNSNTLPFLESVGSCQPVRFVANSVEAVEEPVICPPLGLKGSVDMIARATTVDAGSSVRTSSILSVELKTGHFQRTQNAHTAQLALYTLMLQARHGVKRTGHDSTAAASQDGLLLYLNNESIRALHIAPTLAEVKSLIGQRNLVAVESTRVSRPRGVELCYENDEEPR